MIAHEPNAGQSAETGISGAHRRALAAVGEQWTPLREAVFGTLAAQSQPASAYAIAEAVSRDVGRRIAPNTIYRMLDLFVSANLATRIESRNAYVASTHPLAVHDCIFLVCETCGRTDHIDDHDITQAVRERAGERGYRRLKPVVEVKGQCPLCESAV